MYFCAKNYKIYTHPFDKTVGAPIVKIFYFFAENCKNYTHPLDKTVEAPIVRIFYFCANNCKNYTHIFDKTVEAPIVFIFYLCAKKLQKLYIFNLALDTVSEMFGTQFGIQFVVRGELLRAVRSELTKPQILGSQLLARKIKIVIFFLIPRFTSQPTRLFGHKYQSGNYREKLPSFFETTREESLTLCTFKSVPSILVSEELLRVTQGLHAEA